VTDADLDAEENHRLRERVAELEKQAASVPALVAEVRRLRRVEAAARELVVFSERLGVCEGLPWFHLYDALGIKPE
jgi:hypothetical protein